MPFKRVNNRGRDNARLSLLDRLTLLVFLAFLLSQVMGGAIRYFAARHGLAWLPYVPHLLVAMSVLPMFVLYVVSEGISATYSTILILFGLGAAYGLINLNSTSQVLFGLWVLVSFLFGIVALPAFVRAWRRLKPYAVLLWGVAVAGVLINVLYQFPWVGFEYQVGATSVRASRLWVTAGVALARIPGFSTGSYFAASQVLFLALVIRLTARRRWWIPVWVLSGLAIVLTTTKSAIGLYLFFSVLWLFYRGDIRPSWRLLPICAATLDIFLPFFALLSRTRWLGSVRSPVEAMLLGSLADRMRVGWPQWLGMIWTHGSWLLGRGLGGIGAAQQYFEPALYSPADNVAVFLYGTFGVLGLLFLLVYGLKATRLVAKSPVEQFLFFCACIVLLEGLTVDVLGGPFTAMAFGLSLRYLEDRRVGALWFTTVIRSREAGRASGGRSSVAPQASAAGHQATSSG